MPILTTSSGAAAVFDGAEVDRKVTHMALKQEEEQLWRRSGAVRMATVFRVYAASGRFIKDPKVFALSDFLSRALAGEQIEIRSERPVLRSYVCGHDDAIVLGDVVRAGRPGFRQVDAALQSVSLVELAEAISSSGACRNRACGSIHRCSRRLSGR